MFNIPALVTRFNQEIAQLQFGNEPNELYAPLRYIMSIGGKRMRPVLVCLAHYLYNDNYEAAIKPALAVEVFHNFTLMHDDIMDNAPLRRNLPTVHSKWNTNIAILSGDVMLVKAYEMLMAVPAGKLAAALQKFGVCAAQVCEGQQFDMNFESRPDVTPAEYLEMIKLKTAVLLGFSLELGGLLANASEADCTLLKQIGISAGIGFQLKDDLLDVYGESAKTGKQVGGDIISNKKTWLLINALLQAEGELQNELQSQVAETSFDKEEKVAAITRIYNSLNIKQQTEAEMNKWFARAFTALEQLNAPAEKKALFHSFLTGLIEREG